MSWGGVLEAAAGTGLVLLLVKLIRIGTARMLAKALQRKLDAYKSRSHRDPDRGAL